MVEISVMAIVAVKGRYVDWNKKKVIKNGLAKGTYYATYLDKVGKHFSWWVTRKDINKGSIDL
jgi:hypothetical protein